MQKLNFTKEEEEERSVLSRKIIEHMWSECCELKKKDKKDRRENKDMGETRMTKKSFTDP